MPRSKPHGFSPTKTEALSRTLQQSNRPKIIEIVYFKAGGGHVSAMEALKAELERRYPAPEWLIKPVNLQEILKPIDLIYKGTGKLSVLRENLEELSPRLRQLPRELLTALALKLASRAIPAEDVYNLMLKSGETDGLNALLFVLQSSIKLMSWRIEKILKERWQNPDNKPELVVSVIPNFNAVMFKALKKAQPSVPYVTVMTDFVDLTRPLNMPAHFWIEKQAQFLVTGTEEAYVQALRAGYKPQKSVFKTSGMILKPYFYASQKHTLPCQLTHQQVGLSPGKKTAIIMFGGYGSAAAEQIVDQLNASSLDVQTIVMCGRNEALLASLQGKPNCLAVGFVNNVAQYMDLADVFIGKPGPGSISEALHKGLPVMVLNDQTTMPQERPNVLWVEGHQVGVGLDGFDTIAADVSALLMNYDTYSANIARLPRNNALSETADALAKILEQVNSPKNRMTKEQAPEHGPLALSALASMRHWKERFQNRAALN